MNNQKEIWKDIQGFEGIYQVSTEGRVKSLGGKVTNKKGIVKNYREKLMTPTAQTRGYLQVTLTKDGVQSWRTVHRLVMETFIPNPKNLPVINHIDENQLNNRLDNLEWTTHKANSTHNNVHLRRSKPVYMYDLDMNLLEVFPTAKTAENELDNVTTALILRVANNKQNTHAGYRWSYENTMLSNEIIKGLNQFVDQLIAA